MCICTLLVHSVCLERKHAQVERTGPGGRCRRRVVSRASARAPAREDVEVSQLPYSASVSRAPVSRMSPYANTSTPGLSTRRVNLNLSGRVGGWFACAERNNAGTTDGRAGCATPTSLLLSGRRACALKCHVSKLNYPTLAKHVLHNDN